MSPKVSATGRNAHDLPYIERVGVVTKDRNKKVPCRTCGKSVWLDTDGNGVLVGTNADGTRHRCREV